MALVSGIEEAKILEIKQAEIHDKVSSSIRKGGWLPNLFRRIVNKAKDFLQNLIRAHEMPPKPTLSINMAEFRTMRNLMIRVQDEARAIRSLQEEVPKLKEQLSEARAFSKARSARLLPSRYSRRSRKLTAGWISSPIFSGRTVIPMCRHLWRPIGKPKPL